MSYELMTMAEHRAVELIGEIADLWNQEIVRVDDAGDSREFIGLLHACQSMILSQAAARAYPDRYRLLGKRLGES